MWAIIGAFTGLALAALVALAIGGGGGTGGHIARGSQTSGPVGLNSAYASGESVGSPPSRGFGIATTPTQPDTLSADGERDYGLSTTYSSSRTGFAGAVFATQEGSTLADLYATGNVPTQAELQAYAQRQGLTLEQSATGPAKYVDENGVPRLTIKSGSARTPGSAGPHIEVRDPTGQRTDPFGNPVDRRSPGNHYPFVP